MDPAKLKVVELRQELQARGLDTKGVKAILVDRLRAALEGEGAEIQERVEGASPTKSDGHVSQEDSAAEEEVVPEPVQEAAPITEEPAPVVEENVTIAIEDSSTGDEVAEEPAAVDLDTSIQAPVEMTEAEPQQVEPVPVPINQTSHLSSATEESVSASATNASTEDVEMTSEADRAVQPTPIEEENDNAADVPEERVAEDGSAPAADQNDEAMEVTDAAEKVDETPADEASQETTPADELAATKAAEEAAAKDEQKKDGGDSRKRKRSRSPSPKRRQRTNSTAANIDDFTSVEDEPEIDADKVQLSWYDSDLQLRITSTDMCEARPISDAAFGLVWAGARATHGVRAGQKVFYEVQLAQKNSRVNFEHEKNLFNLRCGWSVQDSDLHLGEGALSFGFDGEGKKVRAGEAEDYGRAFEVDDVVGVYLDLQSDPCTIEYTLNGESLGVAFEFTQEELGEAALFPHILSKNLSFKVNFGQMEQNLLADLKAKPRKKKPVVEAKPVEEEKSEEAAEEKKTEEESAPAAATEEETPAADNAEAAPASEAEEAKEEEAVAAPAEATEDVEMPAAVEEAETKEEAVESEATTEPAEEVKEVESAPATEEETPAPVEEDEPLPEINRENLPGYVFIALVEKEHLVAGPSRPESRKECEVIMMIGLSGAGKTKWVNEWIAEHPEKKYVVLGAAALINRMKNPNLGRKVECSGRRQRLSELCNRSLGAMQDIAHKRRRNYILDQTNVYASAQRRKMKGFGDFRRVAVIVVPSDEEYTKRQEACKNDIDKDNSENELNELKANFVLPTMDLGWFDEIKYAELEEAEATKLVEDYNVKGKKALPPPTKKRNNDYRNDNRRRDNFNNRDNRNYSRWDNRRGGNGGGYDNRGGDRSGGYRSGGGGGAGGGGGGYPYHSGGHGGGGGGGGYRRYDDRRQDRWGGGGGGGGGHGGGGGSGGGNWMNNRRDFRSGGGGGQGGGGRSDYGSRDSHRDQQRNQYSSSSSSRDYHSSSSSSSYRRNDGRDQDFRERRRDDGGITNRRYDGSRSEASTGRQDYHKRDNGSAKSTDMMGNGGAAASQWNNAANWQQQLQWSNWQQGAGQAAAGAQADWNQGWATALQQGWQSGTAAGGWGQSAATNPSSSSSSAGQWKSYGSTASTTGTSSSGTGGASGQAASGSLWNGQQWTGGSY